MGSDIEMESEDEREERKTKEKKRDRSRSRSKDRGDKKKHKKHKKEKKKHRRRDRDSDEGGDTGNEGGDTPEKAKAREATPEPKSEEGEIEEKREKRREYNRDRSPEKKHDRKEYNRDRDRDDGDRRRRRSRSRSRDRHRDRSGSRERKEGRDNYKREEKRDKNVEKNGDTEAAEKPAEEGGAAGGNAVMSLSIEETNKLRAKLGLKPLNIEKKDEVDEHSDQPGVLIPGDRDKTRHLAPEHWGERDKAKKLREKLTTNKDKRAQNRKLMVIKGLGESDSEDDDASKWIERQKNKTKLKEEAEKRAKAMEQLDEEFGVGDIVEERIKSKRQQEYSGKSLKGLRVEHNAEEFTEKTTVLTLKDQDILDDGYEDVLVNVNIVDDEKTKKSLQNIKDGKEGYNAYGSEEVDELTGETKKKGLLYQYNEELDGVKKDSFTLESEGKFSEEQNRERELAKIRTKLKLQNAISLETPDMKIASDYYTEQEMTAFKKPKKKKKVKKKMLKADDLLAMIDGDVNVTEDNIAEKQKKRASRIIDDDIALPDGRLPDNEGFTLDPEPETKSLAALKVMNKLKKFKTVDKVAEEILQERNDDMDIEMDEEEINKNDLIIDQTKEFCRGLSEVNYSKSGLVESVDQGLLDFEKQLESKRLLERSKMEDEAEKREIERKESKKPKRGTWEEVDHEVVESGKWKEGARDKRRRRDKDGRSSSSSKETKDGGGKSSFRPSILDDESMASTGMGAALKLAGLKGYLDQEEKVNKSTGLVHLKCKNYNIEDKSRDHEEDDRKRRGGRGGGRDGYSGGPTQTFSEKKGYKPSVNLEYIDDSGRSMNQKEAFRFLSHKFHGKGSGKLKTEKRHRKIQEDKLMDKMSSTDTPLNTLSKLKSKTKEMATPYVVLSGNKLDASSLKK